MHGAHQAGIMRAHDVADVDRVGRVGNRQADDAWLPVAVAPGAVARRGIPGGRRDDLVLVDDAVPDAQPVAEAATRLSGQVDG